MTAGLCLFTASNSDCLFYSTSVLNYFCKRNFFYCKSRKTFLKINSMRCSADKTGSFSCKNPSIDFQSQTSKSEPLGNHLPVWPGYCPQLRWSDHYGHQTYEMAHRTESQQKQVAALLYLWKYLGNCSKKKGACKFSSNYSSLQSL